MRTGIQTNAHKVSTTRKGIERHDVLMLYNNSMGMSGIWKGYRDTGIQEHVDYGMNGCQR